MSEGGHLHISVLGKRGEVIGGHVFGPLVASATVEAVVGECMDLSFIRQHDRLTGYNELEVKSRNTFYRVSGEIPARPPQLPLQEGQMKSNMAAHGGSGVRVYALRLGPGEEIVESLKSLVARENLKAAFIMTCVGSLTKAKLRLAHEPSANPINKV